MAAEYVAATDWTKCSEDTSINLGGGQFTGIGVVGNFTIYVCPDDSTPEGPPCCASPPGPDYLGQTLCLSGPFDTHCEWYRGAVSVVGNFVQIGPNFLWTAGNWTLHPEDAWARCGEYHDAGPGYGTPTFHDPCSCFGCNAPALSIRHCEVICPHCPVTYSFDLASGLCKKGTEEGDSCPDGTTWDPICEECVSDEPPRPCWTWAGCTWNPPVFGDPPECWETLGCTYSFVICDYECDECPEGECLHVDTCTCVDQDTGLPCDPNCWWSPSNCDCECCDPDYCWCELSQSCVPCGGDGVEPECFVERGCEWNPLTCDYDCTTPTCPEGEEYDLETCSCQPEGAERDGCDIVETANGWLFVAYRSGGSVNVGISRDAGASFEVTTIATGAATGSEGAAPTLLAVPSEGDQETLFCLFHNANPSLKVYRSADLGETWSLYASYVAYRYPRAAWFADGRLLLLMMNGNALELFHSTDWLTTPPVLISTLPPNDHQLGCLRVDRRERACIVYKDDSDALQQRSSASPEVVGSFTADTEIIAAPVDFPAYALGVSFGFLTEFFGGALSPWLLTETYDGTLKAAALPGITFKAMYPGLWVNRYQDVLFACKDTTVTGPVYVYVSPDEGATWQVLNGGSGI